MFSSSVPYLLLSLISAVVAASVALYLWRHRAVPGVVFLIAFNLGAAWWSLGYLFQLASGANLTHQMVWFYLSRLPVFFLAPTFLTFALHYTGRQHWNHGWAFMGMWVPQIVHLLLSLTNEVHHLIWQFDLDTGGTFALLVVHHQWLNQLLVIHAYLLLFAANFLLVHSLLAAPHPIHRGQIIGVSISILLPWLGNILFVLYANPLDIPPLTFSISTLGLVWALLRHRLLDLTFTARTEVLETLRDGWLALDERHRIVDLNPAAARILGLPGTQAVGMMATEVFGPWPQLHKQFDRLEDVREIIALGTGEARHDFEVLISPLLNRSTHMVGHSVLIHSLGPRGSLPLAPPSSATSLPLPLVEALPSGPPPGPQPETSEKSPPSLPPSWSRSLIDFFLVPVRADLQAPTGLQTTFYQLLEQGLTLVLRVSAPLAAANTLFTHATFARFPQGLALTWVVIGLVWIVALNRPLKFQIRALTFLGALYCWGFVQNLGFGYSASSLMFYILFIVAATLLLGPSSGLLALALTSGTLFWLGWFINTHQFFPLALSPTLLNSAPLAEQFSWATLTTFITSALGLYIAILITYNGLNRAWKQTTQTLALVQQERDLLEQRVLERTQALTQSELKYRTLIEQLPAVVYRDMVDETGTNTYISPQAEAWLGYSQTEWAQDPNLWQKILHPAERHIARASIAETLEHGQSKAEYRLFTRDHRTIWVCDSAVLVRDSTGQPQFIQGIFEDITSRKEAEAAQQATAQRLDEVLASITDVIWSSAIPGYQTLFVSPSIERLFGRPLADFYADPQLWEKCLHPADHEATMITTNSGVGQGGYDITYRIIRPDGEIRWVHDRSQMVQDEHGQVVRVDGVLTDITNRKRVEEALQRQNDYLTALHQVTLDLFARRNADEVLHLIVHQASRLLEAPLSDITLVEGQTMSLRASTHIWPDAGQTHAHHGEDWPLAWQAYTTGQPVILEDYRTWPERIQDYDDLDLHAVAVIPIMAGQRCLSTLHLGRTRPHQPFTAEDIQLAQTFAQLAALALDNAQLHEALQRELDERHRTEDILRRQNDYLAALQYIALDLFARREVGDVLQTLINHITRLVEAPYGQIAVFESDAMVLHVPTHTVREKIQPIKRGERAALTWRAHDLGEPIVLEDYSASPEHDPAYDALNLGPAAFIPVMVGSQCLATFNLGRKRHAPPFTAEEIRLAQSFAQLAAVGLDNARLYAAAQRELEERQRAEANLRRQNDYLIALQQIALDLLTRRDVAEVLQTLVNQAAHLLGAPYTDVATVTNDVLILRAATYTLPPTAQHSVQRGAGWATAWQALDSQQPIIIDDYEHWRAPDPDYDLLQLGAALFIPVWINTQPLAVFTLGRSRPARPFQEDEVRLALSLAQLAALILDNTQLYASAQRELAERRLAEHIVQEQNTQLRTLLAALPDLIFRLRRDSLFVDYHLPLANLNEWPDELLTGNTLTDTLPPEVRPQLMHHLEAAFATSTVQRFEFTWPLQNGVRDYEARLAASSPEMVVCIFRDITERKQAEASLLAEIAERKQAEATIRALNDDLRRSNAELERFAYVASHDLQEPLRMISSYTQLFLKRYTPHLEAEGQEYLQFALDGAKRMSALIKALLDYSRMGRNVELEPVDTTATLQAALNNLRITLEESAAQVTHTPLPHVRGNSVLLIQLFQNLISNALKFRAPNRPPHIHITVASTDTPEPAWLITVQDNGIGIEPKNFSRLFQVFSRLHTREEYPGTGIGLATCRKIVEQLGGRIWVESQLGEGTTFLFTLPQISSP